MRLCRDAGIRVGARFTLSEHNAADFDDMLALVHRERIDKFYLSHLNYSRDAARSIAGKTRISSIPAAL